MMGHTASQCWITHSPTPWPLARPMPIRADPPLPPAGSCQMPGPHAWTLARRARGHAGARTVLGVWRHHARGGGEVCGVAVCAARCPGRVRRTQSRSACASQPLWCVSAQRGPTLQNRCHCGWRGCSNPRVAWAHCHAARAICYHTGSPTALANATVMLSLRWHPRCCSACGLPNAEVHFRVRMATSLLCLACTRATRRGQTPRRAQEVGDV